MSKPLGKEFIQAVRQACNDALTARGFRKRGGANIFTYDFNTDILGWIGLSDAVRESEHYMPVFPNIGVCWPAVSKKILEITCQSQPYRYWPVVASNLYGITNDPRHRQFDFYKGKCPEPLADELADRIEEFGLPFMKKLSDPDAVIRALAGGISYESDFENHTAVMMLRGQIKEVRPFINQQLRHFESKGWTTPRVRDFADAVRKYIG